MQDPNRDFTPAELVRIHEANCQLGFVSAEEQNFRQAMMRFIARRLNMAELKSTTITGTGTGISRPKPPTK